LGVTVKFVEGEFSTPPVGPVKVNVVAASGITGFEALEAALVPAPLVAVTVQVYDVPLVRPETLIGLVPPVPVIPPQVAV
jgi:hypothetical protein